MLRSILVGLDGCVEHTVTFLQGHNVVAQAHVLATSEAPAHVLVQYAHQVQQVCWSWGALVAQPSGSSLAAP